MLNYFYFRFVVCALSLIPLAAAASITGTVKDPSARVIAGAGISLQSPAIPAPRLIKTDNEGRFSAENLPPGVYVVSVVFEGFEDAQQTISLAEKDVALTFDLKIAQQETTIEVAGKRSALANSDPNYHTLRTGDATGSYRVENLTFKRDAGMFTFRSGHFSFLPAIEGHVVMAVFTGEGSFSLTPLVSLEKKYLEQVTGKNVIEEEFRSAVLCFTDGTYNYIKQNSQAVDEPAGAKDVLAEFHNRLRHRTLTPRSLLEALLSYDQVPNIEAELLSEVYDPESGGSFRAYMHGRKHADLRFIMKPTGAMQQLPSPEEVAVLNIDPGGEQEGILYLSHMEAEWKGRTANSDEDHRAIKPDHYRLEMAVSRRNHLAATCDIKMKTTRSGARMISFGLLPDLRVARVTSEGHEMPFIQEARNRDGSFYVILPARQEAGRTVQLTVEYEGNKVIEDYGGGNYAVGARTSWYPSLNDFQDRATYDLTFKVPKQFTLVSVGKLVKEWKEDDYAASHWVSDVPLAVAGFNYGIYKKKKKTDEETKYDVETYATSEVPAYLQQFTQNAALSPSAMAENALVDTENAIRCFETWFGKSPYNRIAITQQPQFFFGQSWPTLVYLPVSAFLDSTQRWMLLGGSAFKFAEFIQEVTPHEVAHQWWGHMVGWSSFHDQWLSEGFADFSAGLFLQMTDPKSDKFKKFWDRARQTIVEKNQYGIRATDAGPIWMGLRLNTFKTSHAYNRLVYPKGGYVLHMLRYLMHDDKTGDADFIEMMHDFTKTFANRNASTEDFKKIAEKHVKPNMDLTKTGTLDWFFGEWVYGTEVPRYRLEYSLAPESDGKLLFTGTLTQSDVSENFLMRVPIYMEFDGRLIHAASIPVAGSNTTKEFKIHLPKKPKRIVLNANDDVLASESVVKEM